MKLKHLILLSIICCSQSVFGQKANQQPKTSGNPVFPGWYADPEGVVFGDEYWIYPTYSAPYDEQTFMDAFSGIYLQQEDRYARHHHQEQYILQL